MKVLLTGGSGFIGSSLRKRLDKRFSFVNFDIKENRKNDVRNFARVRKALQNIDGVIHLAAISRPKDGFQRPHECLKTNIMGTVNVLEALRRDNPHAWIIFGSSREVFGGNKKFPVTESSPRLPLNAYAVSKVAGEDLLTQYARNYGLRCLTLRFVGVYTGKHDIQDRVIPRFIRLALSGKPITIEGNGKKKKFDYVFIDDVADALVRAILFMAKKSGGFYDDITLAKNDPISLIDLARLIIELTQSTSKFIHLPERTYDVAGFWGNPAKAKRLLGWSAKTSLKNGLIKSIADLRGQ